MWVHMVSMKLTHGLPSEASDAIVRGLSALKGQIPEILDLEVGHDVLRSGRSFDLGLVVKVADRQALDAYQIHPLHQAVLKQIQAAAETVVAVDFQV